ncbi:MAG: hypothetical protein WC768_01870 [Patescibacteria group bacterium]|jgi:3D (Asp-Asp-Asp) domain-containing protein
MTIVKTIKYRKIEVITLFVLISEFVFPHYSLAATVASQPASNMLVQGQNLVIKAENSDNQKVYLAKPIKEVKVLAVYKLTVTAYSSTVDQCDSDPCSTANGFNLCKHNQEDVIAANFLPFGTKVRLPEYFGDRIFTVQDRMNARYPDHADVWFKTRAAAIKFGAVYTKLEVIE